MSRRILPNMNPRRAEIAKWSGADLGKFANRGIENPFKATQTGQRSRLCNAL